MPLLEADTMPLVAALGAGVVVPKLCWWRVVEEMSDLLLIFLSSLNLRSQLFSWSISAPIPYRLE
jgi:hypothetical protein